MSSEKSNSENLKFEFKRISNNLYLLLKSKEKIEKLKSQFIQLIETTAEILIEGEKNNPEIFILFKEETFIEHLCQLIKKRNRDINFQVIKSFSLLISNLSDEEKINFLLQSKIMDEILYLENENIDNDYLYYYINFIKSLIIKINDKTIEYFFHKEKNTFPILTNVLKFYNHPDEMIRNVVRNILLTILKLNFEPCIISICNLPILSYFNFLGCRMRDMIKTYDKKIEKEKIEDANFLHDELINDIIYIQDIFSLNIERINFILTNSIFYYVVIPLICNSFIIEDSIITKNTSLYILILFFKYIKEESFINCLLGILFMDKLHYLLIEQMKNNPFYLSNYEGDWDNTKKRKKITIQEYITFNYSTNFILTLKNQTLNFPENKKIKKVEDKLKKIENENPYYKILNVLNDCFGKKDNENLKKYHNTISISTGIYVGLSYHYDIRCPINLLRKSFEKIKNGKLKEEKEIKYIENKVKMSFLTFSNYQNENLILIKSIFLHLISINENLLNEFLSFFNFSHPEIIFKFQKEKNEDEEIESLKFTNEEIDKKQISNNNKIKRFDDINAHLTLGNLYKFEKWDNFFLKNLDLLSNNFIKTIFTENQFKYNYDLTSKLFQLITFPPQKVYKQSTLIFLFDILKYLILFQNKEEQKIIFLNLESVHQNQIKRLLFSTVKAIISIFASNNEIKYNSFTIFKEQHEIYEKFSDFNFIIETILKNSFILCSDEFNQKNIQDKDNEIIFKSSNNEIGQFKNCLFSFILCYDLFCKFNNVNQINFDFNIKYQDEKIEEEKKIIFEINEEKIEGTYKLINENVIIKYDEKEEIFDIKDVSISICDDEKKIGRINITSNLKEFIFSFEENAENTIESFKKKVEEKSQLINKFYYNIIKVYFDNIIELDKNDI